MREILFRGKWFNTGEWATGDLLQFHHSTVIHAYVYGLRKAFNVDPDTVCQYTGLKDKNGKKIFEGDICEMEIRRGHPEPSPFLISIKNACVGYEPMFPERCHPDDREWRSFWDSEAENMWALEYFEVIGNIHDNPELMEEDDV